MPSITGGSQFEAGYGDHLVTETSLLPHQEQAQKDILQDAPKRDFENLDVRLYLALKAMLPHWEAMSEQGCIEGGVQYNRSEDEELMAAEQVMRDFEDSHGHLPEWAIARNFGLELVVGTQLFTKNGRRHGNGWLVAVTVESHASLTTRENPYGEWTAYSVLTDAGSFIGKMSEKELEGAFEVGDFICSLDRIAKDFDRHGLLREEVQGG